ncbi:PREDICTED: conserved oligomeric Golgi complex subunit 6-like [Priapulus caudatus]|uniref:Conserved oligomeric Golgi complex subunit 6 n=1 Tax=Priapulus caudatus TaxID=37621 RepID=A0ABM1FA95_PRICU|nr:PREDICTED: conserved oligomeric Golgi complex subunit 6-like [Priapulus caudatus]
MMAGDNDAGVTAAPQQNNPLARKLSKILETRLENDKELLEALKALSTFFTDNSLRTRRNLRSDIECKSLSINEEFAEAFGRVKEELDDVHADVQAMADCCRDMTSRLRATRTQTHELIAKTTKLQTETQRLEMRASVVDAFLERFQLKPEEVKALRGTRDGSLHDNFFDALRRVKQIHDDCKVLLRTKQQTAGLEIMEAMALHQEAAYERLYRWTQSECRVLNSDLPDINATLCQAMRALQDRPVLFTYSVEEFSTARRNAVVRGFIDALTRGGPGGVPRPIELHSHDPLRYVGDMLAWLHQAAASECEHMQSLLKLVTKEGVADVVRQALAHITEGICRPLKVRIEQVVVSEPGLVALYRLANLLKFYEHTMTPTLTADAPLLACLAEMHDLGRRLFFSGLGARAAKLTERVELPPADLGATAGVSRGLALLAEVLESRDSSVARLDARRRDDLAEVVARVVDPLVQACSVSASRLAAVDMAVYMANSLYLIYTTLSLYEFTDRRLEMLQAQVDAHVDTLVSEQASHVLARAELSHVYAHVRAHAPKQGALSVVAGMDAASVKAAVGRFDAYLASPDASALPQCGLLVSPRTRETVAARSVELVSLAYAQIYEAIGAPENGYGDVNAIMPRTPAQVTKLLS